MARLRTQSSRLRFLSLSYYARRPSRFLILFLFFAGASFLLWDRQSLVRQHEVDISELSGEKARLSHEVDALSSILRKKGEGLSIDLDDEESHDFDQIADQEKKDDGGENESESKYVSNHHASILQGHVTVSGLNDALADPDPVARERRDKVREAMVHAWSCYEKYAWGYDELMPVSQKGVNEFGGLGATIIDSLDTLYIMGLHDEFKKATEWVSTNLDFSMHYSASVFETTIRVLGGLVSSYDLSGNPMFLNKAQELADRLLPAWDTATGIPLNTIDLASGSATNPSWTGGSSTLAELGTEQVEFIALSQRTGILKYKDKVEKVIKKLKEIFPVDGLLPIFISPQSGQTTGKKVTFGAMGDSFYEYLLKVWIQGNKTHVVQHYRDMWEQSMEGLTSLVRKSSPSSYVYIAERNGASTIEKMDELACFSPGMLALGADGATPEKANQYLDVAEELAKTCYNFYRSTRTHLAGENYHFRDGQDMVVGTPYNILRPETIESFFYLWRRTGDTKYRDWGWDIFQAFETHSRVPTGYVGLLDVNSGNKDDRMQSFFLAETLKYLYLLFSPSSVIPLDEWVFNTEAHPVKIISRLEETGTIESKDNKDHYLKEDWSETMRKTSGRKNLQNRFTRKGIKRGTFGQFDYK